MTKRVVGLGTVAAIAALALPGIALAAAGDVFVADQQSGGGNGAVIRVADGGGEATGLFSSTDFRNPGGLAQLPDGSLLVVDQSAVPAPGIYQVIPATGGVSAFKTGAPFISPRDVARGADGTLYVTDPGSDAVYKLDPNTRAVTPFASLPASTQAEGIAVTRAGVVYVTNRGAPRSILRIDPNGGVSTFASNPLISDPVKMILTADETALFEADIGSGGIVRIGTADAGVSKFASVANPHGVAIGPPTRPYLLATDDLGNAVQVVTPAGGTIVFSSDPAFSFPDDVVVEPAPCGGRLPTVVGTTGKDVLRGSPFADVISGLQGKDRLVGLGGKDIICGGAGKDTLKGGSGKDKLIGGKGNDKLSGAKGVDSCRGGPGRDIGKGCERGRL